MIWRSTFLSWRIIPRVKFRPCTSSWEWIWRPPRPFFPGNFDSDSRGSVFFPCLPKLMMVNQPKMDDSPMGSSMKMMNYTMPIMSLVICFTLPAFLGLYWWYSSGYDHPAVGDQQAYGGISVEDIIKENIEKQNKKRAKKGFRL